MLTTPTGGRTSVQTTEFPIHINDVSPQWMTEQLRGAGVLHQASVVSVDSNKVGAETGFLSTVARVALTYDLQEPGAPASVVVKLQPDAGAFMEAESELQAFAREIRFYREIAPTLPVRLARVYCTPEDPPHAALVLEDLGFARPADQVVGIHADQVTAAAEAMGRIQARYWNNDALHALSWMPTDNHFDIDFADHWPEYVRIYQGILPDGAIELGERLCRLLPRLRQRIESRPRTITHNDLRADNLFFFDEGGEEEALIIDWQITTRGLGASDVARLIGGSERPEEREGHQFEVLRAWFDVVTSQGAQNYTWDEAVDDFRLGTLAALCCPVHFICDPPEPGSRSEALFSAMCVRLFSEALEVDALSVLDT